GSDQEYAEVTAHGLARHWPRLLGLIHEVVSQPLLAAETVERERDVLLAHIRGLEDQPFHVASRLLARALYGEHGYGLAPSGDPDRTRVRVPTAVLGGGMSSRLSRTLRDAEGLAYSVGSAYPTRRGTGRIVIHLGTAPPSAREAEAGIHREVERLRADGVGEDELQRTKTYMTGAFALDRRTNARQSFSLAFY